MWRLESPNLCTEEPQSWPKVCFAQRIFVPRSHNLHFILIDKVLKNSCQKFTIGIAIFFKSGLYSPQSHNTTRTTQIYSFLLHSIIIMSKTWLWKVKAMKFPASQRQRLEWFVSKIHLEVGYVILNPQMYSYILYPQCDHSYN